MHTNSLNLILHLRLHLEPEDLNDKGEDSNTLGLLGWPVDGAGVQITSCAWNLCVVVSGIGVGVTQGESSCTVVVLELGSDCIQACVVTSDLMQPWISGSSNRGSTNLSSHTRGAGWKQSKELTELTQDLSTAQCWIRSEFTIGILQAPEDLIFTSGDLTAVRRLLDWWRRSIQAYPMVVLRIRFLSSRNLILNSKKWSIGAIRWISIIHTTIGQSDMIRVEIWNL